MGQSDGESVEYISHFGMALRNLKPDPPWRLHVSAEPIEATELDVFALGGEFVGRCPVEHDEEGAWVVLHHIRRSREVSDGTE